jgi:hypothetical protein
MKIGILAGLGKLPLIAAQKLEAENKEYVFFSLISQEHADQLHQQYPKALKTFFLNKYHVAASLETVCTEQITHIFALGKVEKSSVFSITKFDTLGFKILFSLATQSDASILGALEKLLQEKNIQLLSQKILLDSLMVHSGFKQGYFSQDDIENIELGMSIAQNVAQQGIGQTIVIKNKVIVAVEAVEGTDACIQRAYELVGSGLIICKTGNYQGQKVDLPTIGIETLQRVPIGTIKIFVWKADATLLVNPDVFIQKAQQLAIALWAF